MTLQVGANAGAQDQAAVSLPDARASSLGVGPGQIDVSTPDAANASLAAIDSAIDAVSSARGDVGAAQNGLEHVIASTNVGVENQLSARSRIADLDYAKGVADQTRLGV